MVAYIDTKRVIDSSTLPMFKEAPELLTTAPFGQAVSLPMQAVSSYMDAGSKLTEHTGNLGHATPFELRSKVNGRFMGGARLCLSLCFGAPVPVLPLSPGMLPVTNKELRRLWGLVGSAATEKKGCDSFTGVSRLLLPWACSGFLVAFLTWAATITWPAYTSIIVASMLLPLFSLSFISFLNILAHDMKDFTGQWDIRMSEVYDKMKSAGMTISPCLVKVADVSSYKCDSKERLSVLVLRTLGLDVSLRMSRIVTAMEAAYKEKLLEVMVDGEANELLCRVLECQQKAMDYSGTRVITG